MATFNLRQYLVKQAGLVRDLPEKPGFNNLVVRPVKTAQTTLTAEQFRELRIQISKVMMNEIGLDMGEIVPLKPATPDLPALGQPFDASYLTGGLAEHQGDVDGLLADIGQLVGQLAAVTTSFGVVNVRINSRTFNKITSGENTGEEDFQVNVKFTINAVARQ